MKKLLLVFLLIPATLFSLQMHGQIYINFEGVEGDTKIKDKGTEVMALTLGSENATSIGSATTGASSGKVQFADLSFTKVRGKSSNVLQQKLYSGTHVPKVVINYYKAGSAEPFMIITLTTVYITKVDLALTGGEPPTETITLKYGAISFEDNYGTDPAGRPIKPTSSWNVMTNKAQ
ncbi:MAG TPA: type VI secretion system tube protein Hcp [Chitinophagaceae bacterium]|nr:type VI secretion system tube protein Hcp [Chitinophagaceae bacterium]